MDTFEELQIIRDQARVLLKARAKPERLKQLLDEVGGFDADTWQMVAELGWPRLAASESAGGLGMGLRGLSVLCEEAGRMTASLPLLTPFLCIYLQENVEIEADPKQVAEIVEELLSGAAIACMALAEPGDGGIPSLPQAEINDGRLSGLKSITPFAAVADYALVHARMRGRVVLALVDLGADGIQRVSRPSVDNARAAAALEFSGVPCLLLQSDAASAVQDLLGLAAIATAFEQCAGAESAMMMARDYALERKVFGQPIGTFQGIKHNIARMYVRTETAKGCAIDAMESFERGDSNWRLLAAAARIGAIEAYEYAATENVQVHGALGTTWDAMPQHHLRRSRALALEFGSVYYWREVFIGLHENPRSDTADQVPEAIPELAGYREEVRCWLADNAPEFSRENRGELSFEEDLELGRRWQARKAEVGYACINLPEEYGGGGKTELHKIVFCEEELRHLLPIEYFIIGTAQVMSIFLRYAQDDVKKELVPKAISGEHIWCQLFSEPGAGSDLAAVRLKATRASRDGVDGWVLDGQKLWTSWAHVADWGLVVTRSDDSGPKHAGITCFYIDMHSPGIVIRPIRRMVGYDDVNEVFFDNVFVPDRQRLGPEGKGFGVTMEMLIVERLAGAYDESMGGMPLDRVFDKVRSMRINERSAIEDSHVRKLLADAFVERQGQRSIYRRAMRAVGKGQEPGPEVSIRKLVLAVQRQRLGALLMDLKGTDALCMNPNSDFRTDESWSWLDPAARIAAGTDEVLLSTIAEKVLALPQDHRPDKKVPFKDAISM